MSRISRVYHAELDGSPGGAVELTAHEAHHVRRVLRLRVGAAVQVFDGRGAEWGGVLAECSARRVLVRLAAPLAGTVDAALAVTLRQTACRPEKLDWVVQKATEVGVAAVVVGTTARCELPVPDAARVERWRRIAVEACKQCGRRTLPRVESGEVLAPLAPGTLGIALDGAPGHVSLGELLGQPAPRAVALAVGPEGGFAPEETARARALGWRTAALGPRTLRTETAGLVALAIVLHRWSDLGSAG